MNNSRLTMIAPFGEKPCPWEKPNPLWEALQSTQAPTAPQRPNGNGNAHNALAGAARKLAACPNGRRNDFLNWAAHAMRPRVARNELTAIEVRDALMQACHENQYIRDKGENATLATIASGLGVPKESLR